jgi:carbamoyltransferase
MKNLVLAGGVALNCVANGRILREGPFENLWIQPAAGDAGGALGTALFIWHQLLNRPRTPEGADGQQGSFLGPQFSDEEIRRILDAHGASYTHCRSDDELCRTTADLIAAGKVVGWFQGRMEFGPRALGSRSILGDARDERMQSVMNQKIKLRESFRPFAPIVLREQVHRWFQMRPGEDRPYMMLTAPVREEIRAEDEAGGQAHGFEKLRCRRSQIPAVTHVDYSARVQTVDRERHPLLHQLLTCFFEKTGCPVMINTSFNVRGEPIVCTPEDGYRGFLNTDLDALVMGSYVLLKERQARTATDEERRSHLAQFQLD